MKLPDVEASLEKLRLEPGDIVVLSIDMPMKAEQARAIREHFRRQVPDNLAILLTHGLKLSVLSRAEIEAMAE